MGDATSQRTFGVVSDTHGRLPACVFRLLKGVEAILHAGDVGSEDVLVELRALAPVHAVAGNMDGHPLSHRLPQRAVVDLGGLRVGLIHGHRLGGAVVPHPVLRREFVREAVAVIVYGHTHFACCDASDHPWVVNPGSASQPREGRRSVGLLRLNGARIDFQILAIE